MVTLSLLNSLPSGVTNQRISSFTEGQFARTIAQQLIAVKLRGAPLVHEQEILTRLKLGLERELSGHVGPALDTYVEMFATAFSEQCGQAAEAIKQESFGFNEKFNWETTVLTLATLESIDRHTKLLAAKGHDSEASFLTWRRAYQQAFEARHGKIQVPDLSKRLLVPYRKIYIEPTFELNIQRPASAISFREMQLDGNRAVLVGDPGAGKSTAGTIIALEWVREGRPAYVVPLKSIPHAETNGFNLVREIERVLESRYQITAPQLAVEETLLDGSALVVLDGIDEIPTLAAKLEVGTSIEAAARLYAASSFVVTARSIGYDQIALDTEIFTKYTLKPLSVPEIKEYAIKWFNVADNIPQTALAQTIADFVGHAAPIYDICKNPLLLALICILYRGRRSIPRHRPQIYQKCVELLLRDWDESRGVVTNNTDIGVFELALMEIAHRIISEQGYQAGMPEQEILATAKARFLTESVVDSQQAMSLAKEMLALCTGRGWMFTAVGINDEGNDLYSFVHASLLEYFAARYIVRTSNSPRQLSAALLPHIVSGRGEILAQISVNLAGSQRELGGPHVIEQLIVDTARLSDREVQLATSFIVNSADVVPLNRSALKRLLAHCMLLSLKGSVYHAASRQIEPLFAPGFRHFSAVPEITAEFLDELNSRSPEVLRMLFGRFSWAWDVCLENGKFTFADYISLLELSDGRAAYSFFRDAWHDLTGSYPHLGAQWIADQFNRTGVGPRNVARAAACMRVIPSSLDAYEYSAPLPGPEFPAEVVLDTVASFDAALTYAIAYPTEVVDGLVILAMHVAELFIHSRARFRQSHVNEYIRSLVYCRENHLFLGSEESVQSALTESLRPRISSSVWSLLESWIYGDLDFLGWEAAFEQPVS